MKGGRMIKIGELSNITGVSIQTIRFYESEGLIRPIEVDQWTNYRYYDETSIDQLSKISYLKDLGFSLKEIRNLNEKVIQEKISNTKSNIYKLNKNIEKLSSIHKEKEEFIMKNFVNDEKVIGKWKRLGTVKSKEGFSKNKLEKRDIFQFENLYFLPNGEEYWVFSWTKGTLYLKDRKLPYEIINDKLFIGIVDRESNKIDDYAVYEKVDDKHYTRQEIAIKDNTDLPFIKDERVVGFWEVVDIAYEINQFDPNKKLFNRDFYLKKYAFEPDGTLITTTDNRILRENWSKGVVINKNVSTVSKYTIKKFDNSKYLFVEWKSGDYTYSGKVNCYYVFKKVD